MRDVRADWVLDRDAERRNEEGLLGLLAAAPATRVVLVDARGRVALDSPAIHPDLPSHGLTPAGPGALPAQGPGAGTRLRLAPLRGADLDLAGLETFYLGRLARRDHGGVPDGSRLLTDVAGEESTVSDDADGAASRTAHEVSPTDGDASDEAWLAVVVPDQEPTSPTDAEGAARPAPTLGGALECYPLSALRAVAADLVPYEAELATAAVALTTWHARARFCTRCGRRTVTVQAGWAQRCTGCGDLSFPRTDPAVIMAVTDERDRIVLVHGAAWAPGRYSTVAGFVEAGESAEAAVAREVAEETGLTVAEVWPVLTQPWPYPRSLMLAYRARLAPGPARPVADGVEVTDALVLTRDELTRAVRAGRIVLPGRASVAHRLIRDWYGQDLPGPDRW